MTRPRYLAISSLLGIAFVFAAPFAAGPAWGATTAAAAGGMTVTIDAPGDGEVLDENSVSISGTVQPGLATIDVIQLHVYRGDGTLVEDKTLCSPCTNGASVPFSHTTGALAYNGPYTVVVGAAGSMIITGADGSASRGFALAVPPPAPTGVAAEVLPDRKVRVSWRPVNVPDLTAYAVFRKTDGGEFRALAPIGPGTTTYVDESIASHTGPVQYQIVALRQGARPSADPNSWVRSHSAPAVATLSAPPTSPPPPGQGQGQGGTTTTVLGGVQPGGGIGGADLSGLFNNSGAAVPQFPAAAPPPELPDTGYSETLPFGATTAPANPNANKIEGRQQGRPATASGSGDVEPGESDDTNRRALLVPVAAGSVLCVTALHLRWLNRRLAMPPAGVLAGGLGPDGAAAGDLEPAEPDPEAFAPRGDRIPVGAAGRTEFF
jgi:hypothetical protein